MADWKTYGLTHPDPSEDPQWSGEKTQSPLENGSPPSEAGSKNNQENQVSGLYAPLANRFVHGYTHAGSARVAVAIHIHENLFIRGPQTSTSLEAETMA